QRQRRVRARAPVHARDRAVEPGPLAALGADDRVPRGVHDVLDAQPRDVPSRRGQGARSRSREHAGLVCGRPRGRLRGRRPCEGAVTRLEGNGKLLRIFIGESDTWRGRPLYQAIVERVRAEGLAGATVVRGIEGFGADSHLHTSRILRLSEDLPVVIELVDTAERIDAVMPLLDEMVSEGLVTTENVHIVAYRGSTPTSSGK